MIILGIDPGFDRVGWAIAKSEKSIFDIIDLGCIQTKKTDSIIDRYQVITSDLSEIISNYQPKIAAIETLYFSVNKKTALKVSEARGVIILTCLQKNLDISEYNPNNIKLTVTGHGKADKQAVEKMVRMQIPLPNKPLIDDAIDAVAVAMTHHHLTQFS